MIISHVNFDQEKRTVLLVIIERDNLERMRKADPITLESPRHGGILSEARYPSDMSLLIAYEEDQVEVHRLAKTGKLVELVTYLERGRRWVQGVDGKENISTLYKSGAGTGEPG